MSYSNAATELANRRLLPNGFAKVADAQVQDPDHSWAIFRRFDRVATRNLLYLQAKLSSLEIQQEACDKGDLHSKETQRSKAATSWEDFSNFAKSDGYDEEKERMQIALKIQETLKEYYDALLAHSHVLCLPKPAPTTLAAFKHFFVPEDGVTLLRKESSTILDNEEDLVALVAPTSQDRLTLFILEHFRWLFVSGRVTPAGTAYVNARNLARLVSLLSTILAASLLVGAIMSLNYAPNQDVRMAILALFTAAFAGTVALLTSAGRAEVFAATAAYAAVLVVFITGSDPTSSNPSSKD